MPEKKEYEDKKKVFRIFVLLIFIILIIISILSALLTIGNSEDKVPKLVPASLKVYEPVTIDYSDKIIDNKKEQINYISSSSSSSSRGSKKSSGDKKCESCQNDFYSDNYCSEENVLRSFHDFECISGECVENITNLLIEKCGVDECSHWNENYCFNENVYHNRTCYDKGCLNGRCFSNSLSEARLVEECESGCREGKCLTELPECIIDNDCSDDFYSNNYCFGDNVVKDFHGFSCVDGSCVENIIKELVEECLNGCLGGGCIKKSLGLVIIQMDDASAWWNVEITNALVEAFHNADIKLVVEVAPANLNNDIIFLNHVKNWDSYLNIEIAQGFYIGQGFFPPQDNLTYNETRQNLQLGKLEFAQAGISQPLTYIPAWAYGTVDTLDALRDEEFHTELDYTISPEIRDGINKLPLTIDRGFGIIDIENGSLKNESEIKSAVDLMIAEKGFANLAFHHQGFGGETPNTEKINEMITILIDLKNQGYNFITAEGYFQYVNGRD